MAIFDEQRAARSQSRGGTAETGQLLKDCPCLYAYLTGEAWEDGTRREVSTMTISWDEGAWKVGLNDRALKRSCFAAGATPNAAVAALEKRLAKGEVDWRAWRQEAPGPRRKGS